MAALQVDTCRVATDHYASNTELSCMPISANGLAVRLHGHVRHQHVALRQQLHSRSQGVHMHRHLRNRKSASIFDSGVLYYASSRRSQVRSMPANMHGT